MPARKHDWTKCACGKRTYYKRMEDGWTHEKAFNTPPLEFMNPVQIERARLMDQDNINRLMRSWKGAVKDAVHYRYR